MGRLGFLRSGSFRFDLNQPNEKVHESRRVRELGQDVAMNSFTDLRQDDDDTDEADDFLQRLSELDQFVGAPDATFSPAIDHLGDSVSSGDSGSDEASDFLERLDDLDRFVSAQRIDLDASDEAEEFLERLGDLDRFMPADATAEHSQAAFCPRCRRPAAPGDPEVVRVVHILGTVGGRPVDGQPAFMHRSCRVDNDSEFREIH